MLRFFRLTHQDVTITVNQVYGVDIDPIQGINVYLFTGSGSYQGIFEVTDANGQVTFNLPEKDYKVRADYLSQQHWSDVFSWQDVEVDINHGTAILHVTENGLDLYDVPVYLFTESGSYLSRFERTDSSGQVQFLLPADSYKFRVDYDGTQYWSNVLSIIPHEENNIDLQLELLADLTHDPNPDRFDGMPPVYEPEKIMVASLGSIRGLLVQSVVGQTAEEQKVYFFINDHLGTPQKLLNETADVVWSADYKPFGEADVNVNAFENGFRFPGQSLDSETGLHYNYHRYYDSKIGRYLRADPIGLLGGTNLFLYANTNPINFIDPDGLNVLPRLRNIYLQYAPVIYEYAYFIIEDVKTGAYGVVNAAEDTAIWAYENTKDLQVPSDAIMWRIMNSSESAFEFIAETYKQELDREWEKFYYQYQQLNPPRPETELYWESAEHDPCL